MPVENPSASLSLAQAEQLWIQAGGPPQEAPIAAAIADAESGLNYTNYNPTDNKGTQTSWGLWQISDGTHNVLSGWDNPLTNAQMAVKKYQDAGGFSPWGTAHSVNGSPPAYLQYLNDATKAFADVTSGNVSPPPTTGGTSQYPWYDPRNWFWNIDNTISGGLGLGGTNPLDAVKNAPQVKYWWVFAIGILVVLIGIAFVISDHSEEIATVATKAAEAG